MVGCRYYFDQNSIAFSDLIEPLLKGSIDETSRSQRKLTESYGEALSLGSRDYGRTLAFIVAEGNGQPFSGAFSLWNLGYCIE